METPCWCPFEGHKYGRRKPKETSGLEFSYLCVNSSLEELIKIKVIFILNAKCRVTQKEGGEEGYANPPNRYDLLTKCALPFSPWIRNPGKNIWITRKVQNPGPKNRWILNPLQVGSGNPLKSRFESEIRAKIFSKSADPFVYSPPSKSLKKSSVFEMNNPLEPKIFVKKVFRCCNAWRR